VLIGPCRFAVPMSCLLLCLFRQRSCEMSKPQEHKLDFSNPAEALPVQQREQRLQQPPLQQEQELLGQQQQPEQQQLTEEPASDRKGPGRRKAADIPRHETPGSADGQKRYSEQLLSANRKLFALADAWNVELVLLVGGRTAEPVLSSFRPGSVTQWMLSHQATRSMAKLARGKNSARSDELDQGVCVACEQRLALVALTSCLCLFAVSCVCLLTCLVFVC
jgi:hypothetical protein